MGNRKVGRYWIVMIWVMLWVCCTARAGDLEAVKAAGEIRHLGVPYANFVTGSGDGLDVELMQAFARSLEVDYVYVPTTWETAVGDLTGTDMISGKKVQVKGDLLANGITILNWRKALFSYSVPVFPSQVWLVARADHPMVPIIPGGSLDQDIAVVKEMIRGRTIAGMAHTCLDPELYGLTGDDIKILYFKGRLNDLAPAVINNEIGLSLMDVPDALVALEKWPGQIKVIGPVSGHQLMGAAFPKTSVALREAFNRFFHEIWETGAYQAMVERYYPVFPLYYPEFFARNPGDVHREAE